MLHNIRAGLCFRVIVRDVRIVSRDRVKASDHTLDLAHLFERRRTIMDSAVIRHLKKEKEMSLDNIADKAHDCCVTNSISYLVMFLPVLMYRLSKDVQTVVSVTEFCLVALSVTSVMYVLELSDSLWMGMSNGTLDIPTSWSTSRTPAN